MKTYRAKYKDRKGKVKKCSCWHLTFNDNRCIRRRMLAYSSKAETESLGAEIQKLLDNNGILSSKQRDWFAGLIPKIQKKLIEYGIVDGHSTVDHLTTPLADHLTEFIESRRAKACKEYHIEQTESSIRRILSGCRLRLWNDIDGPTVEKFIAAGRGDNGYGQGTYNAHLTAFKTFTNWLKDERELTPDPMSRIKLIKQTEYRKKRRPLNTDELSRLLTTTKNGDNRGNMSGFGRYLVYLIATQCGLRYSEIKALKVLSFDFDANPCTVHVEAENSKGKESADLILNDEIAEVIKAFLADKEPTERAFNLPHNSHAAQMIRTDLTAAGIEFRDAGGRDIDFHSLRGTFITNLFLAGVPAAIVQKLARHKDLKTTQSYCRISFESEVAAIRKLRDLTVTCHNDVQQKTAVDSSGMKNSVDVLEIALSA